MTNADYKRFKEWLQDDSKDTFIHNAGYLWLDLTEKQLNGLGSILAVNPNFKTTILLGTGKVMFTSKISGLSVTINNY